MGRSVRSPKLLPRAESFFVRIRSLRVEDWA
jgi:hypothetical protein